MKSKGIVESKDEFWYRMDIEDLSTAGAFVDKEVWDKFIIQSKKLKVGATRYAHN